MNAAGATRIAAVDRLRELGPVFDLRDLEATFGFSRAIARDTVERWVATDLVTSAGFRTGVYYNLVADPDGPSARLRDAADRIFRRPGLVIGGTALHAFGWTTQRAQSTDLALLVTRAAWKLPNAIGMRPLPRSKTWFKSFAQYAVPAERGAGGFQVVPPAFALADILEQEGRGGLWQPDADDLSLPQDVDPEVAAFDIVRACRLLGVDLETVAEYCSEIDGLDDLDWGRQIRRRSPRAP